MKYKDVDWSKWQSVPSKEAYDAWQTARGRYKITQPAIDLARPHINKLFERGISADIALKHAAAGNWRGVKYQWVLRAISRDMDGLSDFTRQTKDIPLSEQLLDKSWADSAPVMQNKYID